MLRRLLPDARAAAALAAGLVPEVVGFAGVALVVAGVWELAGRAWAQLLTGGLLLAAYLARSLRARRRA